MAANSYIQGQPDPGGVGKALATVAVTVAGAPNSNQAHVEIVHVGDGDDDQLTKRHVGAGTWQAVPHASLTELIAATCKLERLILLATGAGLTVTVQDQSGTPLKVLDAFELPAKALLILEFGRVKMTGGLRWQASAAGVNGAVIAHTA